MPLCELGAKIMKPREFQLPPRPKGASHRTMGELLASKLTLLSLPRAKKPIDRPSGDQKGNVAPSVPSIAVDTNCPRGRTHTWVLPSEFRAPNAILVPSGLRAIESPSSPMRLNVVPSGGKRNNRLDDTRGVLSRRNATSTTTIKTASPAPNTQR